MTMPIVMTTRGPKRGSVTMLDRFELIITQAIIGRNARPDSTGLKPLTFCR